MTDNNTEINPRNNPIFKVLMDKIDDDLGCMEFVRTDDQGNTRTLRFRSNGVIDGLEFFDEFADGKFSIHNKLSPVIDACLGSAYDLAKENEELKLQIRTIVRNSAGALTDAIQPIVAERFCEVDIFRFYPVFDEPPEETGEMNVSVTALVCEWFIGANRLRMVFDPVDPRVIGFDGDFDSYKWAILKKNIEQSIDHFTGENNGTT